MLLFPDHSTLLICISKTQMENVVHNKSKTQDWGLTWGSSAMLNWELWTPNTVSCPSQVFPSFQDSWRALWGLHEVLQEKCHHTESSDGRTFNGRLFAPNILCTSWKTTAQFPRGRAYTNRAKLLDGLSQQFFFLTLFLPLFTQRWKWKVFSGRGCPGHWALKQTHYPQNLGFFSSLILGNSIVQRPDLISWCSRTAEPKPWRGCFSPSFNEAWAQLPNTCDKPHVKTRFHHHLITPQGDYNTPGMFVPALWPQVLGFPPLPYVFSSIPKVIIFMENTK